ncbi:MAG: hypothetical protein ACI80V_000489 [Rhodothermales bacterium]|jgi:hypothetical protein
MANPYTGLQNLNVTETAPLKRVYRLQDGRVETQPAGALLYAERKRLDAPDSTWTKWRSGKGRSGLKRLPHPMPSTSNPRVDAINSWLHHPQSGLVFYVTAMALWSYNPTNDSHELIFDMSEYLSDQELREPNIDLKSSALFYVFALPGNSSRLGLFGYITTRYDTSGDC